MNLKRTVLLLATGGAAIGLIGAGVGASFSDSATATETISVGTFSIALSNPSPGGTVVDSHTITYTAPLIVLSTGTAPLSFTVKDTGSIGAASVTVTAVVTGDTNITSIAPPAAFPLGAGASQVVSVGLQWTNLGNGDLGQSATVVYTITANA